MEAPEVELEDSGLAEDADLTSRSLLFAPLSATLSSPACRLVAVAEVDDALASIEEDEAAVAVFGVGVARPECEVWWKALLLAAAPAQRAFLRIIELTWLISPRISVDSETSHMLRPGR